MLLKLHIFVPDVYKHQANEQWIVKNSPHLHIFPPVTELRFLIARLIAAVVHA